MQRPPKSSAGASGRLDPSAPGAQPTKRALVVERLGGPLNAMIPAVQGYGYEVVRASDPGAVGALVASLRRLSIVLVNGDLVRTEPIRFVVGIKERHPDLPIFWLQNKSRVPAHLRPKLDWIGDDAQQLESQVAHAAHGDFYSPKLIETVITSVQAVLNAFGWNVQASQPCVKSSLSQLGEITAFLYFYGAAMAGHVLVIASMGDISTAYRRQFPSAQSTGQDDIEDFLGEMANQMVGHLKRFLPPDVADFRIGMPHFIRGDGTGFRYKAGTPSLAIEFQGAAQRLQFELCLHRFDGKGPDVDREQGLTPGIVNFL